MDDFWAPWVGADPKPGGLGGAWGFRTVPGPRPHPLGAEAAKRRPTPTRKWLRVPEPVRRVDCPESAAGAPRGEEARGFVAQRWRAGGLPRCEGSLGGHGDERGAGRGT